MPLVNLNWLTVEKFIIPLFFAFALPLWVDYISVKAPLLYNELERLDVLPTQKRDFPPTFRVDTGKDSEEYQRIHGSYVSDISQADTTAIILNWSRFPNVLLIASLLCGPWLDGIIAEVSIWNNSPNKIVYEDFKGTGCPPRKLRIYNSPENVYFQARFLACAQATTPYCFIQDDDYLVRSEIIRVLRSRLSKAHRPHTIHLLPPHEHLSSSLREILAPLTSNRSPIYTSFAWLGHGAILHRSEAADFLSLMQHLNATADEMRMADNYYTVLSNRVPEVWFDQGVELGGGQPFTVGTEGDLRNAKHILQATNYLQSILSDKADVQRLPYVSPADNTTSDFVLTRKICAVCKYSSCLLEMNIPLLPPDMVHTSHTANDILSIEEQNLRTLGQDRVAFYMEHPPSHAVDGDINTLFASPEHGKKGDHITLQFTSDITTHSTSWPTEMVWVIAPFTERILQQAIFSVSLDSELWCQVAHKMKCYDVSSASGDEVSLRECCVSVNTIVSRNSSVNGACEIVHYFRAELQDDSDESWRVYEIFLRSEPLSSM